MYIKPLKKTLGMFQCDQNLIYNWNDKNVCIKNYLKR